jgi:hypothetical protein
MKAKVLLIGLFLLLVTAVATAYDLDSVAIEQLAVQYDLNKAITVYKGDLWGGYRTYGSAVIPKDWKRVYLIFIPSQKGGCVNIIVNGYTVISQGEVRGVLTADITDVVQPGSTATVSIIASCEIKGVTIYLAPPNPALESLQETKEEIKKTNRNLELLKYALIGLGCIVLVSAIYVATQRRRRF